MYTGNIIQKMAGQRIPDELWDKVLQVHDNVVGIAVAQKGTVTVVRAEAALCNKTQLNTVQDGYPDDCIQFFLGAYEQPYQKDSMQPYTILTNGDNKAVLVAFLDGTYPQFAEDKSTHSAPFMAANKYLIPKLRILYHSVGGDIKKLMDMLRDPMVKMELNMMQAPAGFMTLMSGNGEVLNFSTGMEATKYTWGWALKPTGYVEATPIEVVKEEEPSLAAMMGGATAVAPITTAKTEPNPEPVASLAPADDDEYETVIVKIPGNITSKNARKDFVRKTLGYLDHEWAKMVKEHGGLQVRRKKSVSQAEAATKQEPIKSFADLKSSTSAAAILAGKDAARSDKDTTTHHVGATIVTDTKTGVHTVQPTSTVSVLPDADKTALKKDFLDGSYVKKSIDNHSQVIADPEGYKTSLSKIKSFADEMSIRMVDTFKWDAEALEDLCKKNPRAAALLMQNYRSTTPEFKAYIDNLRKPVPQAAAATAAAAPVADKRRGFGV